MSKSYNSEPVLVIDKLCLSFPPTRSGEENVVLSNLSFELRRGEIFGLVGDSGSGKTITALAIAGLLPENAQILSGKIMFHGKNLLKMSSKKMRKLLGNEIGMIFQEPLSSFNPLIPIGKHLTEVITAHKKLDEGPLSGTERKKIILEMLAHVGFHNPERIYRAYPHQLSGGQRQRALIAGSLLLRPSLLIADEPSTALDTVTQSQILDQIKRVSRNLNLSVLFISHDLSLVEQLCDRVAVIHNRRIVEMDSPQDVLKAPKHPHTAELLRDAAFSRPDALTLPESLKHTTEPLIKIKNIYAGYSDSMLHRNISEKEVLYNVSLDIYPGEIMGLVGSSGCGKTTLGRILTGLLPAQKGQIFENNHLCGDFSKSMRYKKPSVGLVFQDPYQSLNPAKTIGWLLEEPLRVNKMGTREQRKQKVLEMLKDVGLQSKYLNYYPHQLSGGQRQRVALAMSLMLSPRLIIADEPVSALDASVQSQILKLLWDINKKKGVAFLFISHDLRVIRSLCRRVAVMDRGQIVESGLISDIFKQPKSLAGQRLISAERGYSILRNRPLH